MYGHIGAMVDTYGNDTPDPAEGGMGWLGASSATSLSTYIPVAVGGLIGWLATKKPIYAILGSAAGYGAVVLLAKSAVKQTLAKSAEKPAATKTPIRRVATRQVQPMNGLGYYNYYGQPNYYNQNYYQPQGGCCPCPTTGLSPNYYGQPVAGSTGTQQSCANSGGIFQGHPGGTDFCWVGNTQYGWDDIANRWVRYA
jgi:hypothetical protein